MAKQIKDTPLYTMYELTSGTHFCVGKEDKSFWFQEGVYNQMDTFTNPSDLKEAYEILTK